MVDLQNGLGMGHAKALVAPSIFMVCMPIIAITYGQFFTHYETQPPGRRGVVITRCLSLLLPSLSPLTEPTFGLEMTCTL